MAAWTLKELCVDPEYNFGHKFYHAAEVDAHRAKVRALVEAVTPYIIIDRCSNPIRERVPDVRYKEYWKLYDCGNCQYCRAKAALAALESDNE